MKRVIEREIYEKMKNDCLVAGLALKLEILNICRLEAGLEPLIDFDGLARKKDISLSDFKVNRDFSIDTCIGFETDKNTGYEAYTTLEPTQQGYRTLLKKYPHLQDRIGAEWTFFVRSEFESLETTGGAV